MIDLNRKIIFTHFPKCGGTTIEVAFYWSPKVKQNKTEAYHELFKKFKHANLTEHILHIESLGYNKNEFFKFTCIRNPWDIAVSRFYHDKQDKNVSQLIKKMRFDEYIEFRCHKQRADKVKFLNIYPFLYHEDAFQIDYVMRLENLAKDFQLLNKKFGVELPKINFNARIKSENDVYRNYYSNKKTRKLVEEAGQFFIETFGYKF